VVAAGTRGLTPLTVQVIVAMVVVAASVRAWPLATTAGVALVRASAEALNDVQALDLLGFSLSPADALNVAFLAGAGWWILAAARRGLKLRELPLLLPLIAFFGIAAATLVFSPAPISGMKDMFKLASAVAACLLVTAVRPDGRRLVAILAAILVGSLHPLLVGLSQFFASSSGFAFEAHGGLRVISVFDHPNHFGTYCVVVAVAAWGIRGRVEGAARYAADAIGVLAAAAMIMTLSRSAWMAAGFVLAVVGWQHRGLLAAALAGGAAAMLLMPRTLERLTNIVDTTGPANSTQIRLEIWSFALPLWQSKPILGFGWGAFQALSNGVYAHNDYLRVAIEAGIVGLAAFVFLMWSLVRVVWRAARGRSDFPRAFLGLALGYVFVSFVTNNLDKLAFQWYFWALAGVALAWPRAFPLDDALPATEGGSS
jgi:O-antigen ligase